MIGVSKQIIIIWNKCNPSLWGLAGMGSGAAVAASWDGDLDSGKAGPTHKSLEGRQKLGTEVGNCEAGQQQIGFSIPISPPSNCVTLNRLINLWV